MVEVDPPKVVAVLEDLFGPRIGRKMAIFLAALACLALAVFFLWVIWTYGGKDAFEFVKSFSLGTSIDDVGAAIATLVWAMIAYGVIIVAILYFFGRALFRRSVSQSALDGLAELRSEGVGLYASRVTDDGELAQWQTNLNNWNERLWDFAKANFPKADYLSIKNMGKVQNAHFVQAVNESHNIELMRLARRLDILDQIISSYRR